jgi:hypothetical protein
MTQTWMFVRPVPKRPVVLAVRGQNGKVVDGCKSRRHKPIIIEFPVLITVRAIPVIRVVVPLVSETHGDAVLRKRSHFLGQPVVQLLTPLAREKSNDLVSPVDKLRSVPPA